MNIVRWHKRFVDFGMSLWVQMAPRECFLDVAKSSDWDLFNGVLVVKKAPALPWNHLGSSVIISGMFKTFHNFVIFDIIFTTSYRCLAPSFQISKIIEIQNEDQIQIRRVELVTGKIIKPKIYV